MHLHKHFRPTFFIFAVFVYLFSIYTFFKKALISNPIEMKYSGDVFEAVQTTNSTWFISG